MAMTKEGQSLATPLWTDCVIQRTDANAFRNFSRPSLQRTGDPQLRYAGAVRAALPPARRRPLSSASSSHTAPVTAADGELHLG